MNCAQRIDADVLVIGAGIAGMCVALEASARHVLLLAPEEPATSSCSALAQGGIAAALDAEDSVAHHILDTLEAACHAADPDAVAAVISRASQAVQYLIDAGVDFDRNREQLSLHREAGHSHARVVHATGDRTGEAIVRALWQRVQAAAHITVLRGSRAIELRCADGRVAGVSLACGEAYGLVTARETVLATGGLGQLFLKTTNSQFATGDGLAMALRAGVRTKALEFVQFHPTALDVAADPLPLLTEALRGAGARLVTTSGRCIMDGRHRLGDLAPRDVVARAVWKFEQQGERVLLDATAIFTGPRGAAFPGARATALRFGIDPARTPMPVTAAAHFHMGGIDVDAHGASSISGLWASGEVACTGLHGANRLASNSLLEAVVYGRTTGAALNALRSVAAGSPTRSPNENVAMPDRDPTWQALRELMWRAMGPMREAEGLRAALIEIGRLRARTTHRDGLMRARMQLCTAMIESALRREESRGAHWRSDFPERDRRGDVPGTPATARAGRRA